MAEKPHLNLAVIGHVRRPFPLAARSTTRILFRYANNTHCHVALAGQIDNGKSTIAGHLLVQTGAVSARHLEKLQAQATEAGKGSFKFAWVLDRFGSERERGITVDMKVGRGVASQFTNPSCLILCLWGVTKK